MIQHLGLLMEASVCFKVLCGSVQHRPENLPLWQRRDSFHRDWRKRSCWTEMLGCGQEEMTTRFSGQLWTLLFSDNTSHLTGSFNAITSRFLWCWLDWIAKNWVEGFPDFTWHGVAFTSLFTLMAETSSLCVWTLLVTGFLFYWHAAFKKTQSNRPITRTDCCHIFSLFCPIAYNIYILN